jgi:type VI secretion system protein ImpG
MELSDYYQKELAFLRDMGAAFAEKYPDIASRLALNEREHPDPHVERLLEGTAFLAARVHRKLDDDFSEVTDAFLNVVYPHYLRPIPAMAVAQFTLEAQQSAGGRVNVPRHSALNLRNAAGITCKFLTCFDLDLWPVSITAAEWRSPAELNPPMQPSRASHVLRIQLECPPGVTFSGLDGFRSLRVHLRGEPNLVHGLYESLLTRVTGVIARDPMRPKKQAVRLGSGGVSAVGFEDNEASIPYTRRSFAGYRLLQEYFTFPGKFSFIDITGLQELTSGIFESAVELLLLIRPDRAGDRWLPVVEATDRNVLRTGCVPVVNVFEHTSDPILLTHTDYEHLIVPDARRRAHMEVFSIEQVRSAATDSNTVTPYAPFFSFRHSDDPKRHNAFWYATRRPPVTGGPARDVYLTFVNFDGQKIVPDTQAITAKLTCTNGDLPSSGEFEDAKTFELKGGGPIQIITALDRPSPAVYPPHRGSSQWRLISHLALNHLSLVTEGLEAFQEILQLYNYTASTSASAQIRAIRSLQAKPGFARLTSREGIAFARGYEIHMDVDEDQCRGSGFYLFVSVVERFLAMYATLNSFTQLTVSTPRRTEEPHTWPPRAGRRILI